MVFPVWKGRAMPRPPRNASKGSGLFDLVWEGVGYGFPGLEREGDAKTTTS